MDTPPPTRAPGPAPATDRTWPVLAHLSQFCTFIGIPGFLGPLVVWLVKRAEDPATAREAVEALNFQLSLWLYGIGLFLLLVFGVLDGSGSVFVAGLLSLLLLALGSLVLPIVAAVRVGAGEPYRYPLTLRLIP